MSDKKIYKRLIWQTMIGTNIIKDILMSRHVYSLDAMKLWLRPAYRPRGRANGVDTRGRVPVRLPCGRRLLFMFAGNVGRLAEGRERAVPGGGGPLLGA